MQFPTRDLTNQFISLSYQDVVQKYSPAGTASYFLDGFGNVILYVPTSSIGRSILTDDQVIPLATSASYSFTSTLADVALVAENALTASISDFATSASYVYGSISSSCSETASFSISASHANRTDISDAISFVPDMATSSSRASSSLSASYSETASRALSSISSSDADTLDGLHSASFQATLVIGNTYTITSSWSDNTSAISFVPVTATSASWVSSSVKIIISDTASYISSTNIDGTPVSAVSASYASSSTSASYSLNSETAYSINFVPNTSLTTTQSLFSTQSLFASSSLITTSASFSSASISASYSLSSSYSPQVQDFYINSLTASFISASSIVTIDPTLSYQVATKAYVDAVHPLAFDYYFRTGSSDIANYYSMYKLDTILSSSTSAVTVNNVSASQYFISWVSPPINILSIAQGNITIHYHVYRVGGAGSNTITSELYLMSASIETQLPSSTTNLLTTDTTSTFTNILVLTSSVITNLTDRLVVKLKCINGTGTPNITVIVDGNTAAGVSVSIPSSTFVLKSGDTLTGALIGNISSATSASYASASISASYSPAEPAYSSSISNVKQNTLIAGNTYTITSSWSNNTLTASSINFLPLTSTSASWVSSSVKITIADTASYVLASNINGTVLSATSSSFASSSISSSFAITAATANFATQSLFATTSISASGDILVQLNNKTNALNNKLQAGSLYMDGMTGSISYNIGKQLGTENFTIFYRLGIPNSGIKTTSDLGSFSAASTNNNNLETGLLSSPPRLYVYLYATSSSSNYRNSTYDLPSTYNGKIIDIAIVRNKYDFTSGTISGSLNIYYNAVLQNVRSTGSNGVDPTWAGAVSSSFFNFGSAGLTRSFLHGQIFNITLFNRALNNTEISQLSETGISPQDLWGNLTDQISGSLINGKRYIISNYNNGDDFINVGGLNTSSIEFIATGSNGIATPASWVSGSTLRQIGAFLDSDLNNANPIKSNILRDNSTNNSIGIISGSIIQINPIIQHSISASYISASDGVIKNLSATVITSSRISASTEIISPNTAKAWATFTINGTTLTTNASYNCTLNRIGTGLYTVAFLTTPTAATYAVDFNGNVGIIPTGSIGIVRNKTTSNFSMSVATITTPIIAEDCNSGSILVFGL